MTLSSTMIKKRIAIITSTEMTINAFLLNHLSALSKLYDITVITSTANPNFLSNSGISANVHPLTIARPISPLADVRSLLALVRFFRSQQFDAVFSVTPKAGLLSMLAGLISRTPLRIHTFTGQVWATRTGLSRRLLKLADQLFARCATHLLTDSESQRQFLIRENVVSADNCQVLAKGSISGVDTLRFKPDSHARHSVRNSLGISDNAILLLFLGRLNIDKGVLDLAQAFSALADMQTYDVHLAFVGPDEGELRPKISDLCAQHISRLHFIDYTNQPETFMAAADIFCLPSYREGFGTVVIEAAAVGIPTVASRIYGLTDAVEDGVTGLLHEPRNVPDLVRCLSNLLESPETRLEMGKAARKRAIQDFSAATVTQALVDYVQDLMGDKKDAK